MDFRGRKGKRKEGASGAIGGHLLNPRPRPGYRRPMLEQERMSGARSLNAVSQMSWQLYCGLKPYCTDRDNCRCLGIPQWFQHSRYLTAQTRATRQKPIKPREISP